MAGAEVKLSELGKCMFDLEAVLLNCVEEEEVVGGVLGLIKLVRVDYDSTS